MLPMQSYLPLLRYAGEQGGGREETIPQAHITMTFPDAAQDPDIVKRCLTRNQTPFTLPH